MDSLLRAVRIKRFDDCARRCVRCAARQTAAGLRPKRSESSRPLPSSRSVKAEPQAAREGLATRSYVTRARRAVRPQPLRPRRLSRTRCTPPASSIA